MRRLPPASLLAASAALSLCACDPVQTASDAGPADAAPEVTYDAGLSPIATVPVSASRDLDLLFVIDNTGSMAEEQASLALNTNRLINVLEGSAGLPNVHIGVISPDLGAGPYNISGCDGDGDNGRLLNAPTSECTPPNGAFISDIDRGDGTRERNYQGSLVDTFNCIARLGINGCGFEQPLEAMRRALDGTNSGNAGFLRSNAHLAIVFITDEDDCSVDNTGMFDTSSTSVSDPLGPLSSYRCFEYGVVCDPDQPRQAGAKIRCVPRTNSPYMPDVDRYVDFVRGLKADQSLISVAAIFGRGSSTVNVSVNDVGAFDLDPTCTSTSGSAAPSIRLAAFLDAFPGRSVQTSICDDDLSDALIAIGDGLSQRHSFLCLGGDIHDTDSGSPGVQPRCEVRQNNAGTVTDMPVCNTPSLPAESTNQPCYLLSPAPGRCADTPSNLGLAIYRADSPAIDGEVTIECELDDAS